MFIDILTCYVNDYTYNYLHLVDINLDYSNN